MLSIREQENRLFAKWRANIHEGYFIADGVVSEYFWHPSNRGVSANVLYYTLLGAVEELYSVK